MILRRDENLQRSDFSAFVICHVTQKTVQGDKEQTRKVRIISPEHSDPGGHRKHCTLKTW